MDKFILITGGTKGIGKAVASCLGKAGYNLILTYASDQAAAEEVRSELVGRFDIQVSISWRRIGYVWTALCSMRE